MDKWEAWDYRVYCDQDNDYGFIEVYYSSEGEILSYSEFINPVGSSVRELEFDLEKMASALNKPVLYYADMPANKGEENDT